jgi:hypothetical protein
MLELEKDLKAAIKIDLRKGQNVVEKRISTAKDNVEKNM